LEAEERNCQGQYYIQWLEISAAEISGSGQEEIRVFEIGQQPEVEGNSRAQQRGAPSTVARQYQASMKVIETDGKKQQGKVNGVPCTVKHQGGQ
jgi:hypothetical protein